MPKCQQCGCTFHSWGELQDHLAYEHGDYGYSGIDLDVKKCCSETLVDRFFPGGELDTEDDWVATLPADAVNGDDESQPDSFCQAVMARRMLQTYQDEPVLEASDSVDAKKSKLRFMFSEHVKDLYTCNMLESDPRTHDAHIDACVAEGMSLEARVECVTRCFTADEASCIGY